MIAKIKRKGSESPKFAMFVILREALWGGGGIVFLNCVLR